MTIQVNVGEGIVVNFPDGTPTAVIERAVQQRFGQQVDRGPAPQGPNPTTDPIHDPRYGGTSYEETANFLGWGRQGDIPGAAAGFGYGAVNDIPIVGGFLSSGLDHLESAISGRSPTEERIERERTMYNNPNATKTGGIVGSVAPFLGLGATALGGRLLGTRLAPGVTKPLLSRGGAGAVVETLPQFGVRAGTALTTGAAISSADTLARGGSLTDAGLSGLVGGGIGGALPFAGAALRGAVRGGGAMTRGAVNAVFAPKHEAQRRVGTLLEKDIALNPGAVLTAADEASARSVGLDLLNVDRGGRNVTEAARGVMNLSPSGRQIIEDTADQRFRLQGDRAVQLISRLTELPVNRLDLADNLRSLARSVNNPAYKAVEGVSVPMTGNFRMILQTPMGKDAFRSAATSMANEVPPRALTGFTVDLINRAKEALDDIVQAHTSIAGKVDNVGRQAANMARVLRAETDRAVPQYAAARAGAAVFGGADNALEAGRNYFHKPMALPEAKRAYATFTASEQKLFQAGLASELISAIKGTSGPGSGVDVVKRYFGRTAQRELLEMAFGPAKMREIEAFVRVETIADRLRGAIPRSDTMKNLVSAGIVSGAPAGVGGTAGYFGSGGNWTAAALAAAAAGAGGRFANQRVLVEMAKLLVSGDETLMQQAASAAAANPLYMKALEFLSDVLAAPARGGGLAAQREQQLTAPPPLSITVSGANPIASR